MNKNLNIFKLLPFSYSFPSTQGPYLPVKTIIRNLGNSFYPRLIQIHQNLTESLIVNDQNYLKKALIPELHEVLLGIKEDYRLNGLRLKLNDPKKKLARDKSYILPETVFKTDNFYISLVCKVYFGAQMDHNGLYCWPAHQKLIRFGKHRYIVYDRTLSFRQNLKLIFSNQIYEFVIKYETNRYINVAGGSDHSSDLYTSKTSRQIDEDIQQDMMTTEILMRSSSEKFDWIIVDINGLLKQKFKRQMR